MSGSLSGAADSAVSFFRIASDTCPPPSFRSFAKSSTPPVRRDVEHAWAAAYLLGVAESVPGYVCGANALAVMKRRKLIASFMRNIKLLPWEDS